MPYKINDLTDENGVSTVETPGGRGVYSTHTLCGLERITGLVRGSGNGLTGCIGTLAEGVARVGGARADIAIAEILPGGIEILSRVIGGCIAGGQAQHGGK
jgi:hypothetical protein